MVINLEIFLLGCQNRVSSKERWGQWDSREEGIQKENMNRGERARKFKRRESKLGSCMDNVR